MPHNIVELKVNWLGKFNRLIIASGVVTFVSLPDMLDICTFIAV